MDGSKSLHEMYECCCSRASYLFCVSIFIRGCLRRQNKNENKPQSDAVAASKCSFYMVLKLVGVDANTHIAHTQLTKQRLFMIFKLMNCHKIIILVLATTECAITSKFSGKYVFSETNN